jgi:hypothetical protein
MANLAQGGPARKRRFTAGHVPNPQQSGGAGLDQRDGRGWSIVQLAMPQGLYGLGPVVFTRGPLWGRARRWRRGQLNDPRAEPSRTSNRGQPDLSR